MGLPTLTPGERNAFALCFLLVFVVAGVCLLPYPGLQNDEVLFASVLYAPQWSQTYINIFKKPFPIMLLSYLGALKAWLYAPLFALWRPSAWSVRLPVIFLGAATIWLFYRLLLRVSGGRAALLGCALLATDTTYLVTTCFDWGPVVLQRLLAVGGVLLLVSYHQNSSRICLGAAFLLFGLALWDKALFGWSLIGFAVAALTAVPGAVRRALNARNLAVALICLSAGAYPLIRYNHKHAFETLRGTVGWSTSGLGRKVEILRISLNGSGLLGYLTYEDPADRSRAPGTALERFSVWMGGVAGQPRSGFLPYCLGAAVLAIPLAWRSKARAAMLFGLVYLLAAWGLMLFGRGVGGAVHHAALLWPWPQFLVAVAFAELSLRLRRAGPAVLAVAGILVCGRALLVSNAYLSQFIRNGAPGSWTDAVYPLSDYAAGAPGKEIVAMDWGIFDPLRAIHRGRLALVWGVEPLRRDPPSQQDSAAFREVIEPPDRVFVSFTDAYEQFPGVNRRLRDMLAGARARREMLAVIRDSHGRPVYEVFRIRRL
jgi:4-amino-4-deoxy-L-arabinose transferase-like glycosyltransferase